MLFGLIDIAKKQMSLCEIALGLCLPQRILELLVSFQSLVAYLYRLKETLFCARLLSLRPSGLALKLKHDSEVQSARRHS